MDIIKPVIIDNDSGMSKAGFGGNDIPKVVFPSIVGHPYMPVIIENLEQNNFYFGDESYIKRGVLNIKYPIEHGIIKNWDDMIRMWHHIFFDKLEIKPNEHPVLITENPLNRK